MKKATKKRDRKYGKKAEDIVEEVVKKKKVKKQQSEVKVMVDYAMIRKFPSREDAKKYIEKQHKEADKANRSRASYVFI